MAILSLALLLLLVAAFVLTLVPWLALGLEVGLAACDRALSRRNATRLLKTLLVAGPVVLILGWWYPLLVALLLVALAALFTVLAMLWVLVVVVRDRSFPALAPPLCRGGVRRSWLVLSLAAQASLWFFIWFAFIRSASRSTHDEILHICQAIPGVKAVDVIGSTNDNLFGDHGFGIELTLNNGGKLGLEGPLWPEDLDLQQHRDLTLYRIGNFTFAGTEVRSGLDPGRALTRFRVVSVGNFTDGVFPFAVTSLTDLVAHYDQMMAVVANWPIAPAASHRTFQGPYGPIDYYYAVNPPGVPPAVDIPLLGSGPDIR